MAAPHQRVAWWLVWKWYAITLPPFGIFVQRGYDDNVQLTMHERAHWDQYERYGLLGYYARYLWGFIAHGYRNHPMEVEARRKAGQD